LRTGPKDRSFRSAAKSFRVKQHSLIMVAQQAFGEPHRLIDALAWLRSIPDDISQAIYFVAPPPHDIGHYRAQRQRIAMNVADNGSLHHDGFLNVDALRRALRIFDP
jgi:hypothetical protein